MKSISNTLAALALVLTFVSSETKAGTFDCSVVYDEFTSLMNKNFLLNPGTYVNTTKVRLSRADYNSRQKGVLLQSLENKGYGVAVVHTNRNTWGKFMFTWGAPQQNGHPSLIIKDLTLYGRVLDGYQPRVTPKIVVPTSYQVDLDTSAVGGGTLADIWFHNVDGNTMFVEAVNGATLDFPMESLCRQ